MYEDGLTLKNGFFRTRHFAGQSSEAGSVELFSEERESEGEEEATDITEAKRRRDRLEREEFIRKCKVLMSVCACECACECVPPWHGHVFTCGVHADPLMSMWSSMS